MYLVLFLIAEIGTSTLELEDIIVLLYNLGDLEVVSQAICLKGSSTYE